MPKSSIKAKSRSLAKLRNKAGLANGEPVEFSFERDKIVITRKVVIDRSDSSSADDEYTPAQRRSIDARLAKSLADVKKGRTQGPFDTAEDMITSVKQELKRRRPVNKLLALDEN